ncbi:MAG: glyoxylate/hydroxypyruvate reductase A [Woeseiaceae bacterium]|nr:glyoxylate/hydroxypyruvate reductase A [Woeseiaceae bacterium]|tara:strand:- start:3784 stop:4710 length:927 start_codon:yes stop_codon:yes gene_type:complete
MSVLYKGDTRRQQKWQEYFAKFSPEIPFFLEKDIKNPECIKYILAWDYSPEMIENFPNLEVFFALGAGIDQFDLSLFPKHLSLVRLIDPSIIDGMVEYVIFASLALHRDMLQYHQFQSEARWETIQTTLASNRKVGIMGLGSLGQAVINGLKPFGFPLHGWSRSIHDVDGVICYAGPDGLQEFLSNSDILICLIPLTPKTQGILNKSLFDQLPSGAGLINVGRGGHLVEQDLLDSLDEGHLSAAVLDVMAQEPALSDHPFWQHPRIIMTPHIASITNPDSAAQVVIDNLVRHKKGQPMIGEVERVKGY